MAYKTTVNPFDYQTLGRQIRLQKKAGWDLKADIAWNLGIDLNKYFLPLDEQNIVFPGASEEQALALSQMMGLIVNGTIAEMENALPKLRHIGCEKLLDAYPVGPEMYELGDLFFLEEAKHSQAFGLYLDEFCHATGIDRKDLETILPKSFGSYFQNVITSNASMGGHAFWWIVSTVEEVSMRIFHQIQRHKNKIDPLYFDLHRRHLEEEARHANYAYLMLSLEHKYKKTPQTWWHKKFDFVLSQLVGGPWILSELHKFFDVKKFRGVHPFFDVLISTIPLYERMPLKNKIEHMFMAAPYVSWFLNPKTRKKHISITQEIGAWQFPYPNPKDQPLKAG